MVKAESVRAVHTYIHIHTSNFIKIIKGGNTFIGDDIKGRLL